MSGVRAMLGLVWSSSSSVLMNLCQQADGKKTSIMNDYPLVEKNDPKGGKLTTYTLIEHLLDMEFLLLRNSRVTAACL
jgi:hypothetical protein